MAYRRDLGGTALASRKEIVAGEFSHSSVLGGRSIFGWELPVIGKKSKAGSANHMQNPHAFVCFAYDWQGTRLQLRWGLIGHIAGILAAILLAS
ncbi:hypothetical protein [Pararhizobium sp. A13]|uniref:hypothetical protein n=1 Tax=Pararhizobium sp. A13 TaxID=3133975 RepID=UPI00311B2DE0